MSRIFDALRKAQASRSEPAAPLAPLPAPPPPAAYPSTVARATGPAFPERAVERAPERRRGLPLAAAIALDEEVVQQMTTLRLGLESALPDRASRIVLFQSAQGGEGTTTLAHQFAWTLARDRSLHTLLVDANAGHPSLEVDAAHRVAIARFDAGEGARSGLEGEISINLHGLPVPDEARRAGLFAPAAARELMESVAGAYDWIVVDGPPVLSASDATALAMLADAVVLVVHSGRTKRPVLTRASELLRKAGVRVAGTVLNRRRHEIPEFIYRRL